ncbi:hypothetical protein CRI94_02675 [Longibacter salinarum]|uniref:Uncharacterized protein n=1 Tax=Longibacter salinarum TaxID=1850348 RepID=A0A2A8D331_9BACT|nr:hypothetical protein [Longibacter salinarum]PEN15203.1 hypothetical protein CRI94_02675 [Longibacter salinarum]
MSLSIENVATRTAPGIAVLLLVLAVVTVPNAAGQEAQVPVDQNGTVYTIDAELRHELGLFPDITGFQSAALYELSDGQFELVIHYRTGQSTVRERRTLSTSDVQSLRAKVTSGLQRIKARPRLDQDGRYGLLASTTLIGLAEGGLVSAALGLDGEAAGSVTLIGGATGFFVPLVLTQNANATEAEADMTFYGGLQGAAHGLQLYLLASGDEDVDDERLATGVTALSIAGESLLGYTIARRNDWSGGHAEMTSFTGLSGNLIGYGLARGFVGDGGSVRLLSGLSIAGSLTGAVIGHQLGRSDRYTEGDARIYLQTGLLAANLSGSTLAAADVDGEYGPSLAVTLAGTGGLVLGRYLVRNRDFTSAQGNLVVLGGVAGSLFGGGIAVATEATEDTAVMLQALGSLAGSAFTYGVFAGDAARQARQRGSTVGLNLRITPTIPSLPGPNGRRIRLSDSVQPKVSLTARF